MKPHNTVIVVLAMVLVSIVALTLGGAWSRDVDRGARKMADDISPQLANPIALSKCYRVNCDSAVAANVLVPMDGGSAAFPNPANTIYIAPCTFDDDGGPGTCDTQLDITVGSSDISGSTGIRIGPGGVAPATSLDAKNAYCMGPNGDQQADVCIGKQ